ncbi:MAG: TauD/TfdA family dioxygenase [Proteobacteria bacterium]|nr:TauD/TfdA family dioxygenase [Pseudomonadota bacterium]
MALQVRSLNPALGAAVTGVDFREPLTPAIQAELNAAWMAHLVLVFPDQPVTDAQHVTLTRVFGEPEIFHQDIIKSRSLPEIFRLSNVDDDGNLMPPAHPTMQQINLARRWHTDSSYRENPAMGSMLHGVEVSRTGGLTCFINLYDVYDALPPHLREAVHGRKARHDFEQLSRLAATRKLTDAERKAMPPVWQPLVRRHPVTGRTSLYISPIYNDAVTGMDDGDAVALIEELAEFADQERFIYRHEWETDDILIWDNRCTMHLVTPHDPMERRVMHRTTIVGDGPVLPG